MEIIWGSTGKAIFRVYSKYEAWLLQYGWKGRNWVEYTLRKTNKTKPWCLCVGVKKREVARTLLTFQARTQGDPLLWQLRSGHGRAPGAEELSLPHAADRPTDEWGTSLERWKLILDMRVEVKERPVCLEAIKCSANQETQPVTT